MSVDQQALMMDCDCLCILGLCVHSCIVEEEGHAELGLLTCIKTNHHHQKRLIIIIKWIVSINTLELGVCRVLCPTATATATASKPLDAAYHHHHHHQQHEEEEASSSSSRSEEVSWHASGLIIIIIPIKSGLPSSSSSSS